MSKHAKALAFITKLIAKYGKGFIFRGTTERFSLKERKDRKGKIIRDGISSNLYRTLAGKISKEREDLKEILDEHGKILLTVMEEEISENAVKISPNSMRKHDALTVIQHFGGKTKNIDFSYNIHIALFFACQKNFDKCGELIILHKDKDKLSLEKEGIKITDATNAQDSRYRVSFQESVFARSDAGYIAPELCKIEEIDKELKEPILEYLWEEKKINRNAVYGDWDVSVKDQENIENATPYFEEGLASQNKGEHKKAIACYDKGLEINPNVPAAYNNRGNAYAALGEHDRAIEDINKALSFNLNYAEAYNNRGVSYKNLKQYERAIEDYSRAIELKPDYATAYNNRGNTYSDSGQYELAIKDYDKAISLNPDRAGIYNNRAISYAHLKKYERAIEDFDKSILLNPSHRETYFNRGNAYNILRQYERAIKEFDKAISIKPDYAEAYNNRGNAYNALKQYKRAIEDFDKAIKINPNFAEAYNNRGCACNSLGEGNLAIKDYGRAISINPNYAEAYYNRAAEKYEKGDMEGAKNDFFKAIRRGLMSLAQKEFFQVLPLF